MSSPLKDIENSFDFVHVGLLSVVENATPDGKGSFAPDDYQYMSDLLNLAIRSPHINAKQYAQLVALCGMFGFTFSQHFTLT